MKNKGLTLVELLIVIIILGIVASFTTVTVSRVLANTKENSFINTAKTMISTASTAYDQDDDLWNDNIATLQELIDNDYIVMSPTDPWGGAYDTTNSFVTVDAVLKTLDDEIFLSTVMDIGTNEVFKVKLISSYATIGYDAPLSDFDNDHVIYLISDTGFVNGIIENITGNLTGSISGDEDNDSVTIENDAGRSSSINTFDGDDSITVNGDVIGNATVNAGAGDDSIDVGRLRGRAVIDGGAGNDTITIDEIRYYTTIRAGAGADTVNVSSVTNNYKGSINMGSGDDILNLSDSGNIFAGINGSFNGGDGNDTLNLPDVDATKWNAISHMFSNFETIVLKNSTITN